MLGIVYLYQYISLILDRLANVRTNNPFWQTCLKQNFASHRCLRLQFSPSCLISTAWIPSLLVSYINISKFLPSLLRLYYTWFKFDLLTVVLDHCVLVLIRRDRDVFFKSREIRFKNLQICPILTGTWQSKFSWHCWTFILSALAAQRVFNRVF